MRYVLRAAFVGLAVALISGIDTRVTQGQSSPQDRFARYALPSQCVGARYRAESRFWRDKRPDTVSFGPLGRKVQPSTITEVKECVARFDMDRVNERDLLGLGFAYLLAEQEPDADRAFARLLRLREKKPVVDRAWALRQIIEVYAEVAPARLSRAHTYMQTLDGLGAEAAVDRLLAHLTLARCAQKADSIRFMDEELQAGLIANRDIAVDSVRQQRKRTTGSVYGGMAYVRMRRGAGPTAATALAAPFADPAADSSATSFDDDLVLSKSGYGLLGKPAPLLQATRWFNGRANESYPAKHKVAVVLFVRPPCGDDCYSYYAVIRRLGQRFGANLDIVAVIRTVGYFRNKLVAPADEIENNRKYLLDDLRLPVTLGIWQAKMGHLDDGRLETLTNPNEDAYQPSFQQYKLPAFVIDKRGNVRFISGALPTSETVLHNVIAALMTE